MKNLTDMLKKYFLSSRFFLNYRIFLDQKRCRQCITWEDSNNLLNGRHQRSESCNQCPTVNIVQTLWLIRSRFRKKCTQDTQSYSKNHILQFSKIFLGSCPTYKSKKRQLDYVYWMMLTKIFFFYKDSICLKPHCSTQVKTNNTCSIRNCQIKLLDG